MKQTILLALLFISLTISAQEYAGADSCRANFKYEFNPNVMTLVPGVAINFYDASEGGAKQWFWDFGDGNYSNEQNPMFVFTYPLGSPEIKISPYRTVTLTILTDSCKSMYAETINIFEIGGIGQSSCQAIFKYYEVERDSASGTAKIHFDNYSEGKDLSYFWQFGDGTTSTEKDPEVKFSLNNPEYKVCLTVNGTDSCSDIMCDAVYLQPIIWDTVIVDPVEPGCYTSFRYELENNQMGIVPTVLVRFYSKSDPEATEWYWDFGDGTTSNEPNPTHVYTQLPVSDSLNTDLTKIYYNPFRTVCLTVKTKSECKISYCETFQVFDYNPQPEPDKCPVYFKYYIPEDVVTIPEVVPVQLADISEGDVVSRVWQFDDGSVSTEKEPMHTFDIFQPVHKVCLTVTFADSCVNTFCDDIYVSNPVIDTVYVSPDCPYYIKVDGGFPIEMSSCAGWARAYIFKNDSLVEPELYSWSNGDTLQKTSGLCPFEMYTVKALMQDGCAVWTSFVLSSDGSIKIVSPINWWVDGSSREDLIVRTEPPAGLIAEWQLCDGTVVKADSIQFNSIGCGDADVNLILKDLEGNVVYTENISMKAVLTGLDPETTETGVKLWPNPVNEKLNIRYSGTFVNEMRIDICDITGKVVTTVNEKNISGGREINVNTNSLKTGIYVCRISSAGKIIDSQKFSKK